ncbi:uncharacterized protein LOC135389534 [Ornithodoros turicata]|uniref:uncharacterized protein LOC135389534 n=1 Tax=Ornithodoros turicata TaxID=34597 RepID=UPI003139CE4B
MCCALRQGQSSTFDFRDICWDTAEFAAATVKLQKTTLVVVSVYVDRRLPRGLLSDCLKYIRHQCPGNLIICVDFNAHYHFWGSDKCSPRGSEIVDAIDELDLAVANSGAATFFRPPSSYSAIDISIYSPGLHVTWDAGKDTMGSDHFPIFLTLPHSTSNLAPPPRFRHSVTHWDRYRSLLNLDNSSDITTAIQSSLKGTTSAISKRATDPVPDLKFLNLSAARRRAQRRLRKNPTKDNTLSFNRISAVLRRYSNALRRFQWKGFCTSFTPHTPCTKIWAVVNKLTGNCSNKHLFQEIALAHSLTLTEAANLFGETFTQTAVPQPAVQLPQLPHHRMDAPFTRTELMSALHSSIRRTSPGQDGVTYQAIKNLTTQAQDRLLAKYNAI